MRSRIFTGTILHARALPVRHRFRYGVYFYAFDLDELEDLPAEVFLFGHNRVRPVAIHDRDYLEPGPGSIREKLSRFLARYGLPAPARAILVTSARVLHYVFNPVSFFFCYDQKEALQCVVAQVNNTFGEMHLYLLSRPMASRRKGEMHYRAEKVFHVSPFFQRKGVYDFYIRDVREGDLDIAIHYSQGEDLVFAARLAGISVPLSRWTVAGKLLHHPLRVSLTMPRILWQAARLRFQRRLPYFPKPAPVSADTVRPAPPGLLDRVGRRVVPAFLGRLTRGRLALTYPEGRREIMGPGDGREEDLTVVDNAFFRRTLLSGEIGFGDAYLEGEWRSRDLAGLLRLLAENQAAIRDREHPSSMGGRTLEWGRHLLRPNTIPGSRRNIQTHYDTSNEFFALFLDPTMTYSCALFEDQDSSLEAAQRRKLRSIIEKAGITEGDHVLEIGCGWGSFALEAARSTGCRVTGITISREQLDLARKRVLEEGLSDRVELRLEDYRHVQGTYDRIVSIEMLEAVGHANLGLFFTTCDRVLNPGGRVVIQVITIPHERYHRYRRSSDWIRKHIFPGGHLPSVEVMTGIISGRTGLVLKDLERLGPHYALTLARWRRNLLHHRGEIKAMGYDDRFVRLWEYYFAYCEAGFAAGLIDDVQMVMEKTGRGAVR